MDALPGLSLGKGYDTVSGDIKTNLAVVGKTSKPDDAIGQKGAFSFTLIQEHENFMSHLGIDIGISGGSLLLRASEKFNFVKNCKITTEAVLCVISFSAINSYESFDNPQLSPDAEELLQLNNLERFRQRFGNRFISGGFTGGEFYGCVKIQSENQEKSMKIANEIKASYGLFVAKGHIKVEKSIEEEIRKERIEIHTWQAGGTVKPATTLQDVFDRATEVAKDVAGRKAVPVSVTLEEYSDLKLPNDNISFVEQQHAKKVMEKFGRDYVRLLQIQNDIEYILTHQDLYIVTDAITKDLQKKSQRISDDLNKIVRMADECARDASQCEFFEPNFNIELPKKKSQKSPPAKPIGARGGAPLRLKQAASLRRKIATLKKSISKINSLEEKKQIQSKIKNFEHLASVIESTAKK